MDRCLRRFETKRVNVRRYKLLWEIFPQSRHLREAPRYKVLNEL